MASITGLDNVRQHLAQLKQDKLNALARGVYKAALALFRDSQAIVPVDTGNLKASGFVRPAYMGTKRPQVTVGYTAYYAIYVHEDLELRHGADYNAWYAEEIEAGIKHSRGENQQAKYLEQPFRQNRSKYLAIIRGETGAAA